jgi:hypothetical protein
MQTASRARQRKPVLSETGISAIRAFDFAHVSSMPTVRENPRAPVERASKRGDDSMLGPKKQPRRIPHAGRRLQNLAERPDFL